MSFTTESDLSAELQELENQLANLVPNAVPDDLFARIGQPVNHDPQSMPPESDLDALEEHLGQLAPSSMPMDMVGRMTRAMDRWHEHVPVEEKVVSFGVEKSTPVRRKWDRSLLAAAAAVAMLGAVSALVLPRFVNPAHAEGVVLNDAPAMTPDFSITSVVEPRDAWLLPDSLSHKVVNTTDRGVVMTHDNTPHRCIRVDYVDRMVVQDEQGREIEIIRPSVDIMLLPVETY
ncbi:MAG: hypothetical protein KJO21_09380 [Verrucomicrobiae bacterium]|nr:hypothetical protein [Verrucomicrobiae bacterium]NNJ42351.1 hypothetical protein [Akkermansiaceae bacterium]